MKARKIIILWLLLIAFHLPGNQAFAGTGGPNDGQVMLLIILAVLMVIFGILYFSPLLIHWIRDLWKRFHHC